MRKVMALAVTAALVTAVFVMPATAAKKKKMVKHKVEETITLTLLPLPRYSTVGGNDIPGFEGPGCTAGVADVHKHVHPYTTPAAGTLTMKTEGFTGDWDLYLFDGKGKLLAQSDEAQVPDGAPPLEEISIKLKAKQQIQMVACNWLGAPQTDFYYSYVYLMPASAHHH